MPKTKPSLLTLRPWPVGLSCLRTDDREFPSDAQWWWLVHEMVRWPGHVSNIIKSRLGVKLAASIPVFVRLGAVGREYQTQPCAGSTILRHASPHKKWIETWTRNNSTGKPCPPPRPPYPPGVIACVAQKLHRLLASCRTGLRVTINVYDTLTHIEGGSGRHLGDRCRVPWCSRAQPAPPCPFTQHSSCRGELERQAPMSSYSRVPVWHVFVTA